MSGQQSHDCDRCGGVDRIVIHNVRYMNSLRRFCTACVLKTFPGSFCPVCFSVFEKLPPPSDRAMCLQCPSISHLACTGSGGDPACRHCLNRSPNYFELRLDGRRRRGKKGEEMDLESAKKLLAAAWIASASVKKAEAAARAEAERRAREVVVARREAKEALETLLSLSSNDQNGSDLMRFGQINIAEAGSSSGGNSSSRPAENGGGGSEGVTVAYFGGEWPQNHVSKKRRH